jgi:hypothetical protein
LKGLGSKHPSILGRQRGRLHDTPNTPHVCIYATLPQRRRWRWWWCEPRGRRALVVLCRVLVVGSASPKPPVLPRRK